MPYDTYTILRVPPQTSEPSVRKVRTGPRKRHTQVRRPRARPRTSHLQERQPGAPCPPCSLFTAQHLDGLAHTRVGSPSFHPSPSRVSIAQLSCDAPLLPRPHARSCLDRVCGRVRVSPTWNPLAFDSRIDQVVGSEGFGWRQRRWWRGQAALAEEGWRRHSDAGDGEGDIGGVRSDGGAVTEASAVGRTSAAASTRFGRVQLKRGN